MAQETTRAIGKIVDMLDNDPSVVEKIAKDPKGEIRRIAYDVLREAPPSSLESDPMIYRFVVGILGSAVLLVVIGSLVLQLNGKIPIPEVLIAIGSTAMGALSGLLAPSPLTKK